MATTTELDRDDIASLIGHIHGHASFAQEALEANDASRLLEQAEEIEGWAQAIIAEARAAGGRRKPRRG